MPGDVAQGALGREATRLLATIEGFDCTVRGLDRLSSSLAAHIAHLAQFGLEEAVVEELLAKQATVEIINALAIDASIQCLSEQDQADVHAVLLQVAEVARPIAASAETA